MSGGIDKGREIFRDEAGELIEELESALLGLEETPRDNELVGRVFRAMHTLKGSGAMFGFDDIASFTHDIETYFDLLRSGKLAVTKELVDLTLASLDQIRAMLDAHAGGCAADDKKTGEITTSYRKLIEDAGCLQPCGAPETEDASSNTGTVPAAELRESASTYIVRFRPARDVMLTGTNPLHLLRELGSMGECTVTAHTELIPALKEIDPEMCYTCWDVALSTRHRADAIKDVFIFVEGDSELSIDCVDGPCDDDDLKGHRLLGDILVDRGDATPEALSHALKEGGRVGEALVEMGEVTPDELESALAEQRALDRRWAEQSVSSVKVASEKLDVLAELVGELVTAQARLRRSAVSFGDTGLLNISEDMQKLAEMLRDNTLSMRMVPFGTTFTKFKRLVRDLSRSLGKEVVFTTRGGETELDKTVIERLNDPIMHLIRNSIDHGIEMPQERVAAGKTPNGRLMMSASHSGGSVFIRISDDGRGLDPETIHNEAVEKGLLSAEERPSKEELFALIMSPGFTTARSVSSVSGRGVGMDVVKRCMDSLRGSVEIASEPDDGTAITLKLPLTLAIIDGLLVKVADAQYVIPLDSVMECVEQPLRGSAFNAGEFIYVRGELVPCIALRKLFQQAGESPEIEHLVIVEEGGQKVGLTVDNVIGEHQTVIKPLSKVYRDVEGLSGATILGDGMLALIIDVAGLVRCARKEDGQALRAA